MDRNYLNEPVQAPVRVKTYVCVRAYFNLCGVIIPEEIVWEDGRRFKIDRVLEWRPAASLKTGGCGLRFTCRIGGHETYLYLEDNRWFVEKKSGAGGDRPAT